MSAVRSLPVLTNEDAKTCGACGGKCCKGMPGILAPEDVGAPDRDVMRARLVEMLSSGRYAIDWWEGDPRRKAERGDDDYLGSVDYVRPAVKGYEGQLEHPSWGGECTFLRPDGCSMSFAERPHNCRELVPSAEWARNGCKLTGDLDKRAYVLMWLPYADLLTDIRDDVRRSTQDKEKA